VKSQTEVREFHAATKYESKCKMGITTMTGGRGELFCKIMVILRAVLKQFGVKP
jgi:hypothetical protein